VSSKQLEIIKPDSPQWPVYCSLLAMALEFQENGHSKCDAMPDKKLSRRIWAKLKNIDIEASADALSDLGGSCDCEIYHNIMQPWANPQAYTKPALRNSRRRYLRKQKASRVNA